MKGGDPGESGRVASLDVFRAVCVLAVLATHFIPSFMPSIHRFGWLSSVTNIGSFGVTGFFILSSYLLGRILLNEYRMGARNIWRRYFLRRILRIWPLYLLVVLLSAVASKIWLNIPLSAAEWLVTFIYNNFSWAYPTAPWLSHLWSVCAEEQLYILIPVICSFSIGGRLAVLPLLAVLAVAFRSQIAGVLPYPAVWNMTPSHLDAFALGMILASLDTYASPKWLRIRKGMATSRIIMILCALIAISMTFMAAQNINAIYASGLSSITYLVMVGLFGWLLVWSTELQVGAGSWLLQLIGQRSYGLYIFHWPAVWFGVQVAKTHGWNRILLGTLALLVTLIVTEASYRFFESPISRLKQRFSVFRISIDKEG